jgi:hypothetical protein
MFGLKHNPTANFAKVSADFNCPCWRLWLINSRKRMELASLGETSLLKAFE